MPTKSINLCAQANDRLTGEANDDIQLMSLFKLIVFATLTYIVKSRFLLFASRGDSVTIIVVNSSPPLPHNVVI